MFLTSSPIRSAENSSLSTPTKAHNGNAPQELTPRSKVKAMLAAIDNDSDSDNATNCLPERRNVLSAISGNVLKHREHGKETDVSRESEDDGDDAPVAPKGRIAAQLSRHNDATVNDETTTTEDADGDAYARIKKQLLSGHAKVQLPDTNAQHGAVEHTNQDREHDMPNRSPAPSLAFASSSHSTPHRSQASSSSLSTTPKSVKVSYEKEVNQAAQPDGSDSDLPANPQTSSRFMELVAKKRAEREAKQAEDNERKREKMMRRQELEHSLSRNESHDPSDSDEERIADRHFTQQSRPTRKAGKKALEEMSRETQRMSRNMQLAHQARTKKKVTKDSLLARFNFRVPQMTDATIGLSSSTTPSSAHASDRDDTGLRESPPTSPLAPEESHMKVNGQGSASNVALPEVQSTIAAEENDELPDMLDLFNRPRSAFDKGKGKAIDTGTPESEFDSRKMSKTDVTQKRHRIRLPSFVNGCAGKDLDSDSDLEVVRPQRSRLDVFNRLPAKKHQDERSMQTLRALAHLNSPEKRSRGSGSKTSINPMDLQRRARLQAVAERNAKIQDLKARGIIVQTAEEREKDQAEVENLIEKARREGEEIMQKEKKASKKEKLANGETDGLPDTSDEDEDYNDDGADNAEVELSGSDDEEGLADEEDEVSHDGSEVDEADHDHDVDMDEMGTEVNGLVDDEATVDSAEEGERNTDLESDDEPPNMQFQRSRKPRMVVEDDEESDDDTSLAVAGKDNPISQSLSSQAPNLGAFSGLFGSGGASMGMTQAFAATMADTQNHEDDDEDEGQDSLGFFGPAPEPVFPVLNREDSLQMIQDSQIDSHSTAKEAQESVESQGIDLHFSQSQLGTNVMEETKGQLHATQYSEIPDPTQDAGYMLSSPAPERFVSAPPSTIDTVLLTSRGSPSPVAKRKGRLVRRSAIQTNVDDEEKSNEPELESAGDVDSGNVFAVMKQASKKAAEKAAFDKTKSEAKGMVEEQAQESEDEYAGLGGASDDESGGEEDELVRGMMDHGEVNVNERELAAFYANKERASDEKAVEKLFKDINSGMLRRKRGADFDLSDSDDDGEARRRRKRREFAKMRKALLENENVGKIAEDPKKQAFLRSIEDRDEEDFNFLDQPAEDSFRVEMDTQEDGESQSQLMTQQPSQPELSEAHTTTQKRPLQESKPDTGNMRPPAPQRRTQAPKKPASLAEIRESVSFLIEEPGAFNTADPSSSASEDESTNNIENHSNPRRISANPIIDRLVLKRAESASTSASTRLAFHNAAAAQSAVGNFKVPSLLRRATTSQLAAADNNHGITTAATERAAGGGEKGDFIRKGGSKKCSVNYFSRESEKRAVVEGVERRMRLDIEKQARSRRAGLGKLVHSGSFD